MLSYASRVDTADIAKILKLGFVGILIFFSLPNQAFAHDEYGIFASTMAIDEPTVGDELDIVFSSTKNREPEEGLRRSHGCAMELSKVILPHFGVSIGTNYQRVKLPSSFNSGFDNIEIGGKYEFYIDYEQNFLLSLALIAEIGGTGRKDIGAHSHSSLAPALYFGKGLGNLDEDFKYLKPIVLTGVISPEYCMKARKVEDLELGFSVQYRLSSLYDDCHESYCYGLFNNIIPLVEFPLSISMENHHRGQVEGSVNPGILFSGHYLQLGLEATIPINKRSGSHVGALAQVHLFLDNLFNCCF